MTHQSIQYLVDNDMLSKQALANLKDIGIIDELNNPNPDTEDNS